MSNKKLNMKKIILAVLVFATFVGCSSDESGNNSFTTEKLVGKWYLNGGTINNGNFVNYQHNCTTSRDFQEISSNGVITFNGFNSNCDLVEVENSNWTLDGNKFIVKSFPTDPFIYESEFSIQKLTSSELILRQDGINENSGQPEFRTTYLSKE